MLLFICLSYLYSSQPGEDVVAKVEKFRRGANYTAMWLPKMEWIVSIVDNDGDDVDDDDNDDDNDDADA